MGEHGEHAERILSELAEARDSILSGKLESPTKSAVKPTPSPVETIATPLVNVTAATDRETPQAEPTPREDLLKPITYERTAISSKPSTRSQSRSGKPVWQQPWATAAGGAIAMLLIMMLFGSGEETQEPANQSTNTAPGNQQKTQLTTNNKAAPDKVAVAPPLAIAPFDAAEAKAHQAAWAKYLGVPVVKRKGVDYAITFNLIPAGTFIMGSPKGEAGRRNEEHQHTVTISKAFYMQNTEVTQRLWKIVMGTEPWKNEDGSIVKEGRDYPAVYIRNGDAVTFCERLSARYGKTYRLPTEAEWEYACRAGSTTAWNFGDDEKSLNDYAWYKGNAWDIDEKHVHQVGLKNPNAFGLYDMHGNVSEWCNHKYHAEYYKGSPLKDPLGPAIGDNFVFRGGSFGDSPIYTRSANRNRTGSKQRGVPLGLRLVYELD